MRPPLREEVASPTLSPPTSTGATHERARGNRGARCGNAGRLCCPDSAHTARPGPRWRWSSVATTTLCTCAS